MAIDTTEKKLSLMDFDEVMCAAVPYPDGSLDQGDLQHGLWSYSGIAFATTVAPTGGASASWAQQPWADRPWQHPAPASSPWSFSSLSTSLRRSIQWQPRVV